MGADRSWSYIACGRKRLYQAPTLPCVRHCTRPLKYFPLSVWGAGSGGLILHRSTYVLLRSCGYKLCATFLFEIYRRIALVIGHSLESCHYIRELENGIIDFAHKCPVRWVYISHLQRFCIYCKIWIVDIAIYLFVVFECIF